MKYKWRINFTPPIQKHNYKEDGTPIIDQTWAKTFFIPDTVSEQELKSTIEALARKYGFEFDETINQYKYLTIEQLF